MTDNQPTETVVQPAETPKYIPPVITVYKEEELLKTVAVLGCSPF